MKILPSIELLSEVLGKEIASVGIEENTLNYIENHVGYFEINIYELAYIFKLDAIKYDVFISSFVSHCIKGKGEATVQDENGNKKVFIADTEPEAIFKAREWIRTQISS